MSQVAWGHSVCSTWVLDLVSTCVEFALVRANLIPGTSRRSSSLHPSLRSYNALQKSKLISFLQANVSWICFPNVWKQGGHNQSSSIHKCYLLKYKIQLDLPSLPFLSSSSPPLKLIVFSLEFLPCWHLSSLCLSLSTSAQPGFSSINCQDVFVDIVMLLVFGLKVWEILLIFFYLVSHQVLTFLVWNHTASCFYYHQYLASKLLGHPSLAFLLLSFPSLFFICHQFSLNMNWFHLDQVLLSFFFPVSPCFLLLVFWPQTCHILPLHILLLLAICFLEGSPTPIFCFLFT